MVITEVNRTKFGEGDNFTPFLVFEYKTDVSGDARFFIIDDAWFVHVYSNKVAGKITTVRCPTTDGEEYVEDSHTLAIRSAIAEGVQEGWL